MIWAPGAMRGCHTPTSMTLKGARKCGWGLGPRGGGKESGDAWPSSFLPSLSSSSSSFSPGSHRPVLKSQSLHPSQGLPAAFQKPSLLGHPGGVLAASHYTAFWNFLTQLHVFQGPLGRLGVVGGHQERGSHSSRATAGWGCWARASCTLSRGRLAWLLQGVGIALSNHLRETEAQRGQVACPGTPRHKVRGAGWEARSRDAGLGLESAWPCPACMPSGGGSAAGADRGPDPVPWLAWLFLSLSLPLPSRVCKPRGSAVLMCSSCRPHCGNAWPQILEGPQGPGNAPTLGHSKNSQRGERLQECGGQKGSVGAGRRACAL